MTSAGTSKIKPIRAYKITWEWKLRVNRTVLTRMHRHRHKHRHGHTTHKHWTDSNKMDDINVGLKNKREQKKNKE